MFFGNMVDFLLMGFYLVLQIILYEKWKISAKLEYQNQGKCMSKYQKSDVWNKLTDFLVINKPNNYA